MFGCKLLASQHFATKRKAAMPRYIWWSPAKIVNNEETVSGSMNPNIVRLSRENKVEVNYQM
jgi:hypothetical protein